MFQHILVPLDGSASDQRAVEVAARLAQTAGGVVILLRVVHPHWESDAPLGGLAGLAPDDFEAREAAEYLARVRQHDALADIASSAAIAVGSVVPAILKVAREDEADLIVLSQRRRTPLLRWARGWLGSEIAEQVTRRATVPVLVLHEEDRVAAMSACGIPGFSGSSVSLARSPSQHHNKRVSQCEPDAL